MRTDSERWPDLVENLKRIDFRGETLALAVRRVRDPSAWPGSPPVGTPLPLPASFLEIGRLARGGKKKRLVSPFPAGAKLVGAYWKLKRGGLPNINAPISRLKRLGAPAAPSEFRVAQSLVVPPAVKPSVRGGLGGGFGGAGLSRKEFPFSLSSGRTPSRGRITEFARSSFAKLKDLPNASLILEADPTTAEFRISGRDHYTDRENAIINALEEGIGEATDPDTGQKISVAGPPFDPEVLAALRRFGLEELIAELMKRGRR